MKRASLRRLWPGPHRATLGERLALTLGKGILAGLAGTAAMSLSQMVEMRLSRRRPSTTPAAAAGRVLGVQPRDPAGAVRFAYFTHWAYGTAWGLVRAMLGGGRRRRLWAPFAQLSAVQTTAMLMLPALGVAPPVEKWGGAAIGKEVLHHVVYVTAADAAYRALS